jgi:flagellar FlgN protein
MTATALTDPLLTADLLVHLDAQLASTERLLDIVLAQGTAIRTRDVDAVVRHVANFQAELQRRARVEEDRTRLLLRAGAALGAAPETVTLSQLTAHMTPDEAERAHHRSAELQRVLAQLQREHSCNQALMRQELAFLDHLLRLVDPTAPVAYEAGGTRPRPMGNASAHRQLDLQA